jgi:hypothetical protein
MPLMEQPDTAPVAGHRATKSTLLLWIIIRVGFETRMAMIRGGGVVTIPVGVLMIPRVMRRRVRRRLIVRWDGHFVDDRRGAEAADGRANRPVDPAFEYAVRECGRRQAAHQQSPQNIRAPRDIRTSGQILRRRDKRST